MRNIVARLRKGLAWLLSAIAFGGMFLVFGYVRALFAFADCDGGKPDLTLGGVVASGFGATACIIHRNVTTDTAAPASASEGTGSSAGEASTSQDGTTPSATTNEIPAGTPAPPVTQPGSAYSFHGFTCEEATCAGHQRGYEWASEKDIDDPHTCYHGPRLSNPRYISFSEGCEAYVDETTGAARLDPSERYSDGADDNGQ